MLWVEYSLELFIFLRPNNILFPSSTCLHTTNGSRVFRGIDIVFVRRTSLHSFPASFKLDWAWFFMQVFYIIYVQTDILASITYHLQLLTVDMINNRVCMIMSFPE